MPTRTVAKDSWKAYLDRVADQVKSKRVEIEVDSPEIGAQIEAEGISVAVLTYDEREDAISIVADEIDHRISNPRALRVIEEASGLQAVEIVGPGGEQHIVRFRAPLMLPEVGGA